jgi:hypothetical protein
MRRISLLSLAFIGMFFVAGCTDPVGPAAPAIDAPQFAASPKACWGQASKVFARMGMMGEHSAMQESPRLGLGNLARLLYEMGVIPEPTMQALGAFVAAELGLDIDACM